MWTRRIPLTLLLLATALPSGAALAAKNAVRVSISGISGELAANVRASLSLNRPPPEGGWREVVVQRRHARAEQEIRTALQPFGHYHPQVAGTLRRDGSSGWIAEFVIDAGPPTVLAGVELRIEGAGADDARLQPLLRPGELRPGQVLRHALYEQGKRRLLEGVRQAGYLDAVFATSRVVVDMAARSARVELHVASGRLYRFGAVRLSSPHFADRFLGKFIPFAEGDPFAAAQLTALRKALYRSAYFQSVAIDFDHRSADADGRVPLEVTLTPFKQDLYRARLGYGTDTEFGLRLNWDRRYLGASGHRLHVGAIAVQDRNKQIAEVRYEIPLRPLLGENLLLAARHEGKDLGFADAGLDEGDETRIINSSVSLSRRRHRQWGDVQIEQSYGVTWLTERHSIFDLLFGHFPAEDRRFFANVLGPGNLATLDPDFRVLAPGLGLSLRRSDPADPARRRDFLRIELTGAAAGFASNASFAQIRLEAAQVRSLYPGGRLIGRTEIAYTRTRLRDILDFEFNGMPEAYEFRTGGDRSVRGYAFETLQPDNSFTGGRHLLAAGVELEHRLAEGLGVATFYDLGNAFNHYADMDLHHGIGLGGRLESPAGSLRLDLAHPLESGARALRLHFSIGLDF